MKRGMFSPGFHRGFCVFLPFTLQHLGSVWYGVMEWMREWNGRGNGMDEGMQWIITIPCLVWLPCGNGMNYYCVLFGRQEKRRNKISGEWCW